MYKGAVALHLVALLTLAGCSRGEAVVGAKAVPLGDSFTWANTQKITGVWVGEKFVVTIRPDYRYRFCDDSECIDGGVFQCDSNVHLKGFYTHSAFVRRFAARVYRDERELEFANSRRMELSNPNDLDFTPLDENGVYWLPECQKVACVNIGGDGENVPFLILRKVAELD